MKRWTVRLEGGPKRVNHAAVAIQHRIFSFGGYCTGEDYETRRPIDVHILNTLSNKWSTAPSPGDPSLAPYHRYGHTVSCWSDKPYLIGGRDDAHGGCDRLFCFDTTSYEWSQPTVTGNIPGARDGHSTCVIADSMYLYGGYEAEKEEFSNEVFQLNFIDFHWTLLLCSGGAPQWRDFHTTTAIGDRMFLFGGRSDRGGVTHTNRDVYDAGVMFLDTRRKTWHRPATLGSTPTGRRSHSAWYHNEKLYIFGGYNGNYDVHFNDIHQFDAETSEWSLVRAKGDPPCPRRRQCCVLVKDKVYLFGGTSPQHNQTDFQLQDHSDLYILDLAPSLKTLCLLVVHKHKLDFSILPNDLKWELKTMTTNSTITRCQTSG